MLDEHMLPAMFSSCVKEPNPGCAAVKLALICIGAHVHVHGHTVFMCKYTCMAICMAPLR